MSDSVITKNQDEMLTRMTTAPIGRLIVRMAIPTIISMMITAIYNMTDTFFVSQLGTSASGAVGINFSIMTIIQALGFTIGMGSGSLTSRALGGKNYSLANKYCSSAICFSLCMGTVLSIIGLTFQKRLVSILGATPTIQPYAEDYARYILIGVPFMCTTFVMNNQLRFQGKAAFSMIGLTIGGVLNMILDPIFIFVLKLGISGAAIATLLSQCISFSILLSVFLRKKSVAELALKNVSRSLSDYTRILKNGLPSLFRQGMATISSILLNVAAGGYGDAAVAGMSITNRVFLFLMSIAIGIGQGFQPVCGMNFGAHRFDRVKQAFFFMIKVTSGVLATLGVFFVIFAPQIVSAFRNDPAVIAVGALAMRCQCAALPLQALIFGTNMMLQTTGEAKAATFLSSLRQGLYFIPLILILPHVIGITGVQIAQSISDILTSLTSIPFAITFFHKMNKMVDANKVNAE
ncbi:MAG: MATE family efflux transporter [Treponema sp.]|nr:MATE family efflux transporter [Treponema sp.]